MQATELFDWSNELLLVMSTKPFDPLTMEVYPLGSHIAFYLPLIVKQWYSVVIYLQREGSRIITLPTGDLFKSNRFRKVERIQIDSNNVVAVV